MPAPTPTCPTARAVPRWRWRARADLRRWPHSSKRPAGGEDWYRSPDERSDIRGRLMVKYRRNFVPGAAYFFTVTLADRRSSALVDRNPAGSPARDLHVAPWDADFSGRWRRIKGHFSSHMIAVGAAATRHASGEYALWQRRFWEHTIRDEDDFARHVDYIHFNPVKHGLVSRVRDWPYSSFHLYVRRGLLPEDWAGDVREMGRAYGERRDP